jgi:hypothetical protein
VPEALAHPQVQALGILAAVPGQDFASPRCRSPSTASARCRARQRLSWASTMRRTVCRRAPDPHPKETS